MNWVLLIVAGVGLLYIAGVISNNRRVEQLYQESEGNFQEVQKKLADRIRGRHENKYGGWLLDLDLDDTLSFRMNAASRKHVVSVLASEHHTKEGKAAVVNAWFECVTFAMWAWRAVDSLAEPESIGEAFASARTRYETFIGVMRPFGFDLDQEEKTLRQEVEAELLASGRYGTKKSVKAKT